MTQAITPTVLGDATIAELAEAMRGEVIGPTDPSYDEARAIWNGAHDRRPALIVRCAGVAVSICKLTCIVCMSFS